MKLQQYGSVEGNMNPVLLIFTQITVTGCGFLVYFLYAVGRESRKARKRTRVQIRTIASQPAESNVIQLDTPEKAAVQKRRGASGR